MVLLDFFPAVEGAKEPFVEERREREEEREVDSFEGAGSDTLDLLKSRKYVYYTWGKFINLNFIKGKIRLIKLHKIKKYFKGKGRMRKETMVLQLS